MEALLYQVNHSANIGMIIRTAVGFNISKLYFYDPKEILIKKQKQIRNVSQGTIDKIEIITITNPNNFLEKYKGRKIATICGDSKAIELKQFTPNKTDLVIFGNERGLPKEIIKLCETKINISLVNELNSLNLACAFSIIAYKYSN